MAGPWEQYAPQAQAQPPVGPWGKYAPQADTPPAELSTDEVNANFKRALGLTARAGLKGVSGTVGMLGDALNSGVNMVAGTHLKPVTKAIEDTATASGLPVPQGGAEEGTSNIVSMLAGTMDPVARMGLSALRGPAPLTPPGPAITPQAASPVAAQAAPQAASSGLPWDLPGVAAQRLVPQAAPPVAAQALPEAAAQVAKKGMVPKMAEWENMMALAGAAASAAGFPLGAVGSATPLALRLAKHGLQSQALRSALAKGLPDSVLAAGPTGMNLLGTGLYGQ